jgi:hypothetical protein
LSLYPSQILETKATPLWYPKFPNFRTDRGGRDHVPPLYFTSETEVRYLRRQGEKSGASVPGVHPWHHAATVERAFLHQQKRRDRAPIDRFRQALTTVSVGDRRGRLASPVHSVVVVSCFCKEPSGTAANPPTRRANLHVNPDLPSCWEVGGTWADDLACRSSPAIEDGRFC